MKSGTAPTAIAALFMLALSATARAEEVTIPIANFTFTPEVVTVAPGTMVTWVNEDDIPHNVAAVDKSFHSRALDTGESFSFTFGTAGEFAYFCGLHPQMTGKVIVR